MDHTLPTIPRVAHLIWFGASFPWVNVLAVRSAALRGGFERVLVHHDSDLSCTAHYRELVETPRVELRRLDVPALLERCQPLTRELGAVFARLSTPATKSDLVRFALLYDEGGVYLDIDTVTVADFSSLCVGVQAFCGLEHIVYSARVRASYNPVVLWPAHARAVLRDLLRRMPEGHRQFRRIERYYDKLPNPAILASAPRARFVAACLEHMITIAPERQSLPNVIGPHLLQHMVPRYAAPDLAVHEPRVFFPLGPEVSEHWFRLRPRADLREVLSQDARLVHWYGSVRTKHIVPKIDPSYVRAHAGSQLFSALALPFAS